MVLATPVVVGGISVVARIAEWMAPLMAGLYALMAIVVLVLHAGAIPGALAAIVSGAFGHTPFADAGADEDDDGM